MKTREQLNNLREEKLSLIQYIETSYIWDNVLYLQRKDLMSLIEKQCPLLFEYVSERNIIPFLAGSLVEDGYTIETGKFMKEGTQVSGFILRKQALEQVGNQVFTDFSF